MREDIECVVISFVFVALCILLVVIPIRALTKDNRSEKCWEMPYSEYKKDTRCQALLEDK